ncbi:MAG: acetoacetate--CoA ligase [Betaproteobacteria bacterium]|nr:acetoacetate--CoA ligase [Betaproteobacteria bacterium]
MENHEDQLLWAPSPERIAGATVTRFMREAGAHHGIAFADYAALHRWSIEHMEDFWRELWTFCGVIGDGPGARTVVNPDAMPGARFFPDAKINFAENLLRRRDDADALVFWGEDRVKRRMSFRELAGEVARAQQALKLAGVGEGDRVCAIAANTPEAIVGMLATSSLGAIWSSCSPDFGVQGILDRFGQIEPKVLVAVDGYYYNGKTINILDKVAEVRGQLPSVKRVVVVPYVHPEASLSAIASGVWWGDFLQPFTAGAPSFLRLPFNHPLYILFSSGTTGVPKCIVHGAGGTLLQHMKEQQLQCDVRHGDRLFYFTTCGWMMWNWLASGLATGATLLLYDGSPFLQGGRILWEYAQAERMTHFGTSAKYIDALKKAGLSPKDEFDLATVRTVLSTGSPLAPESFDYVYEHVKRDVCLSSMSGGTDIVASFVGGMPILPVYRGEIQCKILGMAVEAFDDNGKPYPPGSGQRGELVCTRPIPSMPIGFWNDPGDARYRAAYFEQYPGVWCHGDFVEITARGGVIIYGRSDATLNPGGVRIGTAEIYRQVEQLDEVVESLVIGQDWDHDVRVVLFVRLRDGLALDDALIAKIKQHIRTNTTPRHVPAKVLQVADIPRTKSNKIVELAVRNIVHGRPVKNVEALANPEALEFYRDRDELRS